MSIEHKYIINNTQFYHDLKAMGRDNFSYEGSKALMGYLNELSENIGENIEYDPIAFCCDFSEYADYEDIYTHYDNLFTDAEECEEKLHEHTTVIEFNGGIIIQDF
jgi:hypothetical protein